MNCKTSSLYNRSDLRNYRNIYKLCRKSLYSTLDYIKFKQHEQA